MDTDAHMSSLIVTGTEFNVMMRSPVCPCVLQGERSLLMQFSMKVTVGVLFLIGLVR